MHKFFAVAGLFLAGMCAGRACQAGDITEAIGWAFCAYWYFKANFQIESQDQTENPNG